MRVTFKVNVGGKIFESQSSNVDDLIRIFEMMKESNKNNEHGFVITSEDEQKHGGKEHAHHYVSDHGHITIMFLPGH
jgi:hypothetical protein